jgi:AmmeMemoRadiSam system protein A
MSPLSSDDRRALLDLARRAIVEAVSHDRLLECAPPAGALAEPRAAFVTLHRRGRLRGCIGRVEPEYRLAETVVRCAISAARDDPRFPAVESEEVGELEIEISVLSPLERTPPEEIELGRHGLMIVQGARRGLLLPQVAVEHKFTRERFLAAACEKAGLAPDAWKDAATQVLSFTAEVFSDSGVTKRDPRSAA